MKLLQEVERLEDKENGVEGGRHTGEKMAVRSVGR